MIALLLLFVLGMAIVQAVGDTMRERREQRKHRKYIESTVEEASGVTLNVTGFNNTGEATALSQLIRNYSQADLRVEVYGRGNKQRVR